MQRLARVPFKPLTTFVGQQQGHLAGKKLASIIPEILSSTVRPICGVKMIKIGPDRFSNVTWPEPVESHTGAVVMNADEMCGVSYNK